MVSAKGKHRKDKQETNVKRPEEAKQEEAG